jgi:hypothetical protein
VISSMETRRECEREQDFWDAIGSEIVQTSRVRKTNNRKGFRIRMARLHNVALGSDPWIRVQKQ